MSWFDYYGRPYFQKGGSTLRNLKRLWLRNTVLEQRLLEKKGAVKVMQPARYSSAAIRGFKNAAQHSALREGLKSLPKYENVADHHFQQFGGQNPRINPAFNPVVSVLRRRKEFWRRLGSAKPESYN